MMRCGRHLLAFLVLFVWVGCHDKETSFLADSRGAGQEGSPDLGASDRSSRDSAPSTDKGWTSIRCIKRVQSIEGCTQTNGGVEICDGKDNDCNGLIDDVDTGKDGIYDCDKVALLGNAGANSSADFIAWLEKSTATGSAVRMQTTGNAPTLTMALLEPYNMVVLDWLTRDYTDEEAEVLRQYVAGGCGVVSMTGHVGNDTAKDRPSSLLARIGIRYTGALVTAEVSKFYTHAVTQGIVKPVPFNGGFPVEEVTSVTGGTTTKVADLPSGLTAGMVQERGQGRVFVWGDEWISFDSEWNKPTYDVVLLWQNVFKWLGRYK
jgi:hypothetical protein